MFRKKSIGEPHIYLQPSSLLPARQTVFDNACRLGYEIRHQPTLLAWTLSMKEILFLHPVGQAFAFACGLFNLLTGLTRRMFNLSIHINCGAIYYFTTLLGAGLGIIAAKWADKNGIPVDMEVHEIAAMLMVLLLAMGATTGLVMLAKREKRTALLAYHRWINILSIAVFCVQAITGMAQLVKLL